MWFEYIAQHYNESLEIISLISLPSENTFHIAYCLLVAKNEQRKLKPHCFLYSTIQKSKTKNTVNSLGQGP